MQKSCIIFGLLLVAAVTHAGIIETSHTVEPVGAIVHEAPAAVSHQSFTRVHNKAIVAPVVAPVLKTTVHAAVPVVHTVHEAAPFVHTVHAAAPVVQTLHAAAPMVHTYATSPVVHSVPAAYTLHH